MFQLNILVAVESVGSFETIVHEESIAQHGEPIASNVEFTYLENENEI